MKPDRRPRQKLGGKEPVSIPALVPSGAASVLVPSTLEVGPHTAKSSAGNPALLFGKGMLPKATSIPGGLFGRDTGPQKAFGRGNDRHGRRFGIRSGRQSTHGVCHRMGHSTGNCMVIAGADGLVGISTGQFRLCQHELGLLLFEQSETCLQDVRITCKSSRSNLVGNELFKIRADFYRFILFHVSLPFQLWFCHPCLGPAMSVAASHDRSDCLRSRADKTNAGRFPTQALRVDRVLQIVRKLAERTPRLTTPTSAQNTCCLHCDPTFARRNEIENDSFSAVFHSA